MCGLLLLIAAVVMCISASLARLPNGTGKEQSTPSRRTMPAWIVSVILPDTRRNSR
jgi:hypothetical protein